MISNIQEINRKFRSILVVSNNLQARAKIAKIIGSFTKLFCVQTPHTRSSQHFNRLLEAHSDVFLQYLDPRYFNQILPTEEVPPDKELIGSNPAYKLFCSREVYRKKTIRTATLIKQPKNESTICSTGQKDLNGSSYNSLNFDNLDYGNNINDIDYENDINDFDYGNILLM